jgi:hypothetical protein
VLGGVSGWRLPAREELLTIVDFAQDNPSIDPTAFPDTPSSCFWASSPAGVGAIGVWAVNFRNGDSDPFITFVGNAGYFFRVRCVGGSRCYPTSRFVVLSGGLVRDTLTNLVWQQQASTTLMTWADAQTYCSDAGSGFRLPTVKELVSIVDLTVTSGPLINQTAFPGLPANVISAADVFWTSSPTTDPPVGYNDSSGSAWYVPFVNGIAYSYGVGNSRGVRCVR